MVSQPDSSLPSITNPQPPSHNKHSYPSVSKCPSSGRVNLTTTTTTTIERTPRSTYYSQHTSHAMSSPQGSPAGRVSQSYMLVPNLHVPDPTVDEVELASSNAWMVATVIEDGDLMFGGKPLSAWYEEDRRRLSSNEEEEEIRGRQRDRVRMDAHHQHHHHQHHHHQPQHHHHNQHHTTHHTLVAHTHHTTNKTGDIKH